MVPISSSRFLGCVLALALQALFDVDSIRCATFHGLGRAEIVVVVRIGAADALQSRIKEELILVVEQLFQMRLAHRDFVVPRDGIERSDRSLEPVEKWPHHEGV
jgi:hypothetical protein